MSPVVWPILAPRGMVGRIYVGDHLTLLHTKYKGVSINNQPILFPINRDGHDFHALFQYMIYKCVQNYTRIEWFFNKILNVKHGYWCKGMLFI